MAPRLDASDTYNEFKLVAAPSRSRSPVIVNPSAPPSSVDLKLTIEASNVRSTPLNVTAPS